MGQFALGIRSLLIKIAIFVVLAALLAWTLGGTLFPRAETSDAPGVTWHGATWRLRAEMGGEHRGRLRWTLMRQETDAKPAPWVLRGFDEWSDAVGPVATTDSLYVAFRDRDAPEWTLATITDKGFETAIYPDRLEIERQFARLRSGLALETPAQAQATRERVLKPE